MRASAFLRNVPVLSELSDELLEHLAGELREVRVRAGDWLLREDEPAESLFIVRSGRVDVVAEGPPETLLRVLRRGDVVGELALLREGTRSASARAQRDTELLELGRSSFEELIRSAPSFAVALVRTLGGRLAASRTPVFASTPPRTIAVVGLDPGAPVDEVAQGLAEALGRHGPLATLAAGELGTIDRAEHDADRVLLRGGSVAADPWTELCVGEADLVLAVTTGTPELAWRDRHAALQGCELLVLGQGVAAGVVDLLRPREVQVVADPADRRRALEMTARRLVGRAPGVVLSGGGARAFAHLGVLEVLREAGMCFDRIGGVSLGSLVGAATALDLDPAAVYEVFERSFDANPTNDFVPPAFSLIRGAKTRRLLEDAVGDRRIEELPLRFFCLSCDLVAREAVVHKTGRVVDAVYASLAIPGIFPPVATPDGRLLVDGGVLDNLPVATMARSGEGPVVAIDVTGRMGGFTGPKRPRAAQLERPVRRALTGSEAQIPRLGETILRTVTVGSIDTVAAARLHAELVITPPVDGIGLLEWGAIGRVRDIGRRAAHEALEADPDLARRLTI